MLPTNPSSLLLPLLTALLPSRPSSRRSSLIPPLDRRLINIVKIHRDPQEPHVHVRLIRQIPQQDLQPRAEIAPEEAQPFLQRGQLALDLFGEGIVQITATVGGTVVVAEELGGVGFLAGGEVGDGPGVEAVDGVAVGEHGAEELAELDHVRVAVLGVVEVGGGGVLFAAGAEEALLRDGLEVGGVGLEELVEGAALAADVALEFAPGGLDDLEEDVVLELAHEVDHFGQGAAGGFPGLQDGWVGGLEDAAGAGHAFAPGLREGEFHAFDAPEEVEDFEVLAVAPFGDDDVDGRVDFVFEGEAVPADIAVGELEHAGVEATEDFG